MTFALLPVDQSLKPAGNVVKYRLACSITCFSHAADSSKLCFCFPKIMIEYDYRSEFLRISKCFRHLASISDCTSVGNELSSATMAFVPRELSTTYGVRVGRGRVATKAFKVCRSTMPMQAVVSTNALCYKTNKVNPGQE